MNQFQDEDLVYFYEYGELGEQIPAEEGVEPIDLSQAKYTIEWGENFYLPWTQPGDEAEGRVRAEEQLNALLSYLEGQGIRLKKEKVTAQEVEVFGVNDWQYTAELSVESISPWVEFGSLGPAALDQINAVNALPADLENLSGNRVQVAFAGSVPSYMSGNLQTAARLPLVAIALLSAAWIADSASEVYVTMETGEAPSSGILGLDEKTLWPIAAVGLLYFGAKLK
jgi:hypothetical protein